MNVFRASLCVYLCVGTSEALAASPLPELSAIQAGFTGCGSAIRKAFSLADGDVRVQSSTFPQSADKSIGLMVTFGKQGDTVYSNVDFLKSDGKCFYRGNTVTTIAKSCLAYKEQFNSSWRFQAQSADYSWTKNVGGVTMLLRAVGDQCLIIHSLDGSEPIEPAK